MESTIKRIKTAVGLIQDISANLSGKQRNPQEIADAIEQALAKNSAGETSTPEPMREEMGDEDTFEVHSSIAIKKLTPMSEEDLDWCRLALFYQLSALALGIMIASVMNIHLLSMLLLKTDLFVPSDELNDGQKIYLFFDEILTGLVIAGGSQPIHVLLRFLSTRKPPPELAAAIEDDSEEVKLVATQSVSTVTTSVSPAPASLASSFSFTAKRAFPAMAPAWWPCGFTCMKISSWILINIFCRTRRPNRAIRFAPDPIFPLRLFSRWWRTITRNGRNLRMPGNK